jgi:hypothetical protein
MGFYRSKRRHGKNAFAESNTSFLKKGVLFGIERESRREKRAASNYFGHASNLCSATTAQPRTTAIQIWSSCR